MKNVLLRLGIIILAIALIGLLRFSLPPEIYLHYSSIIYFFTFVLILVILLLPKLISKIQKANYKDYISLENIPSEFDNIYENLYNNHINNLELMRKQVRWRTVVEYIVYFFILIGYIFTESDDILISREFDTIMDLLTIIACFTNVIFTFMNRKYKRIYKETYKKEIISSFIKLLNNQLEYKPLDVNLFEVQEDYKKANFDNKPFNRFYPDDYVEGFVDDETFIKLCDIHLQHITGSGKNRHTEEIFQGIFAHTKCGKDIGTYIKVSKNKMKILEQDNRVEMDSKEFEKYFDIYSENKIVAMQLLTSDIMESLVDFHNQYHLDYEIVFRNNTIYMRFFTGPMFEPKIFGNSMDKQLLYIYFCILKFIVEISKKVNHTLQELEV